MKKTIVISSIVVFAMFALVGCGGVDDTEQAAKEAQIQSELAAQKQEINNMKGSIEQEKTELEKAANELVAKTCAQEIEATNTQLEELQKYSKELEDLDKQVKKTPEFAIETCRNLNPGLSKPECDTRVNDFMNGKKVEYEETQEKITETEAKITELESKCAGHMNSVVDANGNAVTEGCQSWFDGCNTCKVGEPGMPMACTMKMCDETTMEVARCLDNEVVTEAKQTCAQAGGVWSEEQSSCFEDPTTMADEGEK